MRRIENQKNHNDVNIPDSIWISILRFVADVEIIFGIFASIIGGCYVMWQGRYIFGFFVIFAGSILSVMSAAGIKMVIDVASDIRRMRVIAENANKVD